MYGTEKDRLDPAMRLRQRWLQMMSVMSSKMIKESCDLVGDAAEEVFGRKGAVALAEDGFTSYLLRKADEKQPVLNPDQRLVKEYTPDFIVTAVEEIFPLVWKDLNYKLISTNGKFDLKRFKRMAADAEILGKCYQFMEKIRNADLPETHPLVTETVFSYLSRKGDAPMSQERVYNVLVKKYAYALAQRVKARTPMIYASVPAGRQQIYRGNMKVLRFVPEYSSMESALYAAIDSSTLELSEKDRLKDVWRKTAERSAKEVFN